MQYTYFDCTLKYIRRVLQTLIALQTSILSAHSEPIIQFTSNCLSLCHMQFDLFNYRCFIVYFLSITTWTRLSFFFIEETILNHFILGYTMRRRDHGISVTRYELKLHCELLCRNDSSKKSVF